MKLVIAALVSWMLVTLALPARAADMTDGELITLCQEELKARQPEAEVQSNTELVSSHVERSDRQIVVDIQVTEAEGRRVTGKCIVRNGKVFDFKG